MAIRNQAPVNGNAKNDSIDTTGWAKENTGFDPYWTPEEGKKFVATLMMRDDRDMAFQRYQFMAAHVVHCQRGPSDNAEAVDVAKGETFSMSVYSNLRDILDEVINFSDDTGIMVTMEITCKNWVKTANQPKCWQFGVTVFPEHSAKLRAWRTDAKKALNAADTREQIRG